MVINSPDLTMRPHMVPTFIHIDFKNRTVFLFSEPNEPMPIAVPGDTYMASGYPDEKADQNKAMLVTQI